MAPTATPPCAPLGPDPAEVGYTRDATDRIIRRAATVGDAVSEVHYGHTGDGDPAEFALDDTKKIVTRSISLPGGVLHTWVTKTAAPWVGRQFSQYVARPVAQAARWVGGRIMSVGVGSGSADRRSANDAVWAQACGAIGMRCALVEPGPNGTVRSRRGHV